MFLNLKWLILIFVSSLIIIVSEAITNSITPTNMLTATNITKPGCPKKCGDLTIPYPFGIGDECSISQFHTIKCDTSYNPPRAFTKLELSGESGTGDIVSITETQILLRNPHVTFKCYGPKGNVTSQTTVIVFDFLGYPFSVSNDLNKLTVIGCDDYALITGYTGTIANGNKNARYNSVGCLALCSNPSEVIAGSCSGLGCCQTSIPRGLQSFMIELYSLRNHTGLGGNSSSFQPCAYAFLAGNNNFTFGGAPDFSGNRVVQRAQQQVPVVLDWVVGDYNFTSNIWQTCNVARKNSTTTIYGCQANTQCVDLDGGGYRCQCLSGFEGNPYLKPGCTDIDECNAGLKSPCTNICGNMPGSYECSCPSGHDGDGLKNGTGCTRTTTSSTLFKITLGMGISLGSILLFLGAWWLHSILQKKKKTRLKNKNFKRNGGLLLQQQLTSDENTIVERMKIYSSDELEKATDNYNENRILGRGGQGIVYKGMLSEGKIVAIKKSKIVDDDTQLTEFINEVIILSQINHRNIVRLLGCCLETQVPLLVYEYIPNGTLYHHIHYPNEEDFVITWKMRLRIAADSAGALAYLHSSSSIPVFHRDIKSSNILLDEKYRAKLSDFGTSRSVDVDQTHVTTRVMGTFGYLDPEYFQSSQFTEKSDVYSFGVVLVELLTGQKAIRGAVEEDRSLISWFLTHMEESRLVDIIDSDVLSEGSIEEFLTIANLAKKCLNLDGKSRPTMKEVLMEIEVANNTAVSQKDEQKWQKSKQGLVGSKENLIQKRFPSSHSIYLEDSTLSSPELSLLYNPR